MKIKTKMVEDNTYICENCNSEHYCQGSILKCECGGKEICEDCSIMKNIYYMVEDYTTICYDIEHLHLCRKCYDKISKKYDKYTNKFDEQQLKLINKLNKVTYDFLEGIKNDQT